MNYKNILFSSLLSIFTTSCVVYYPLGVDIPLVNKKNDIRIDAGISVTSSAQATLSYGLTDKIAIQGFGSVGADDKYYLQAATGFYKYLGNNKVRELYGGFGYGYGNAYKDETPGNLFGNYQLYFLQYNYGKIASGTSNFEIGFGIKSGYLHSILTDQNYYKYTTEYGPFSKYNDSSFLLEPTGMLRLGGKKLKISMKLGSCVMYKFTNKEHSLPYNHVNFSLGLNYRF